DAVHHELPPVFAIGGEVELLESHLIAVAEVECLLHLAAAAFTKPAEQDEAPRHAGAAADRFDVFGEFLEMLAAVNLDHVGSYAVGELGQIGDDGAAQRGGK